MSLLPGPRRLGAALLPAVLPALVLALVMGLVTAPGARARAVTATRADEGDPVATTLSLAARAGRSDTQRPVVALLLDGTGAPVADATVVVERRTDGDWSPLATLTTDDAGRAATTQELSRSPRDNAVRASYAGASDPATGASVHDPARSGLVVAALRPWASRLVVTGPARVVDERSVTLGVSWRTRGDAPVPGRVVVESRSPGGDWRRDRVVTTDERGRATWTVTPRTDTWWRAVSTDRPWVGGDRSDVHAVDNLPPGEPVALPAGAPSPRRKLPPQPHAVGDGPNAAVSGVPDGVWRQMQGRTWHQGCLPRSELRYVRINYWDYSGYRRRGELVVRDDAVANMVGALAAMYQAHLPLRSMYREDRFGWSAVLHGADDFASMAAGNTSAFNCRGVVGNPSVLSPHASGRALDVNTWENPYRSARGIVPDAWWQSRSHPRVAWRSTQHAVVRIMTAHGMRWTYGLTDTQHFDAVAPGSSLRARGFTFRDCGGACD